MNDIEDIQPVDAKTRLSIGWVARYRHNTTRFAGHKARCKVYTSRGLAENGAAASSWSREPREVRIAQWDLFEAFIEVPNTNPPDSRQGGLPV
ncbi:MAG: hypothetical protein JWO24_2953 [Rhodospirillales bacterium]|nr:hypothetical protein [Rhodospirillales bacterium]